MQKNIYHYAITASLHENYTAILLVLNRTKHVSTQKWSLCKQPKQHEIALHTSINKGHLEHKFTCWHFNSNSYTTHTDYATHIYSNSQRLGDANNYTVTRDSYYMKCYRKAPNKMHTCSNRALNPDTIWNRLEHHTDLQSCRTEIDKAEITLQHNDNLGLFTADNRYD